MSPRLVRRSGDAGVDGQSTRRAGLRAGHRHTLISAPDAVRGDRKEMMTIDENPKTCKHTPYHRDATDLAYGTDEDVSVMVGLTVKCGKCGRPFRFIGLPATFKEENTAAMSTDEEKSSTDEEKSRTVVMTEPDVQTHSAILSQMVAQAKIVWVVKNEQPLYLMIDFDHMRKCLRDPAANEELVSATCGAESSLYQRRPSNRRKMMSHGESSNCIFNW